MQINSHIIGAKIDLAPSQRKVSNEYGVQIAQKNDIAAFAEISSKNNVNVDDTFSMLTKFTLERID